MNATNRDRAAMKSYFENSALEIFVAIAKASQWDGHQILSWD
jgi:hypothetical protein